MIDRKQEQIMETWKTGEPCMVSVVCAAYNHESYIRDAIDGFLMQETDFPFEIIIHDDASTDNTPAIIKEYHSRYPDIIKPILQTENQYSKGGFKPLVYAAGYSNAKYNALCEGDDYWINKNKLKIQVEAMQDHPDVDFSFHSAYRLCDGRRDREPSWNYEYNRLFTLESILESVHHFSQTATYMLRRGVILNMPDWFFDVAPVGDTYLEIYGARNGGALYINQPMSIYRVNSVGSWIERNALGSISHFHATKKRLETMSLLMKEMPEYKSGIRSREATCLYHIAIFYLLDENDPMFKQYIEESFARSPFVRTNQGLLYKLRFFPSLLRKFAKKKYSTQIEC